MQGFKKPAFEDKFIPHDRSDLSSYCSMANCAGCFDCTICHERRITDRMEHSLRRGHVIVCAVETKAYDPLGVIVETVFALWGDK